MCITRSGLCSFKSPSQTDPGSNLDSETYHYLCELVFAPTYSGNNSPCLQRPVDERMEALSTVLAKSQQSAPGSLVGGSINPSSGEGILHKQHLLCIATTIRDVLHGEGQQALRTRRALLLPLGL